MKSSKLTALISVVVNLFLALAKFFVGLFLKSIALMADGLHSTLDLVSSIVAYVGIKAAEKPADKEHPYGHEKYESLASFVIVLLLFASAGWILFEAAKNIIVGEASARFSFWGIIVVTISIVANEIMARFKFKAGNNDSSLAMVADGEHSRADAISSVAVLIGLFLVKYYALADSILAVIVSFYIFYGAYRLSKEAIDVLVDIANPELEDKIKKYLDKNKFKYSSIKTRRIGMSSFAEIDLICGAKMKIEEITGITNSLEDKLLKDISELKQVSISVKSHDYVEIATRPFWGRQRRIQHGLGRGVLFRGSEEAEKGRGPNGKCVCEKCGYEMIHKRGVPCHSQKCPKCKSKMARK